MLYSLDRFEGEIAVLVDDEGDTWDVAVHRLPVDAVAGDLFRREGDLFVHDREATQARRARVRALQERLRHRADGGA